MILERFLLSPALARAERDFGVDVDHMRLVAKHFAPVALRMGLLYPALLPGGAVSTGVQHLARMGAVRAADCGPCVQIEARMALKDGVPPDTLRAALGSSNVGLTGDERLAYKLGFALGTNGEDLPRAREELRATLGEAAMVELVVAATVALFFPTLRRGLGVSRSCDVSGIRLRDD